ncbi:MAG: translation initiation factor IF-3 [Calditrichaeota bacterium]|nr:translation initiation factor IF-3 [Calditrichota bacterium]MBT7618543.1 translation initiation factor IF-3 [Calditrichota bacterium]MBT7787827.1 translation initiation factor IF-3 [Calditrichota bacterium]
MRINDEIIAEKVRLIGPDSQQIGVVSVREALDLAEEYNLDLVEIAPTAKPPVCKVIDYGKFKYELSKKEKDARKKQHTVQVKKIRMSPNIDDHDFRVKINMARKFIEEGNRVKATLFMRGRQVTRPEHAEQVLVRIVAELADIAKADGTPKLEGRNNMSLLLVSKK